MSHPTVAIIDYGLGNLFSVQNACLRFGLHPTVCSQPHQLEKSQALILPGVGAFGEAMANLRKLDLIQPIKDFAQSGKPILGICLGIQLLMTESCEFGHHPGLGLIPGCVIPLNSLGSQAKRIPQVGWNRLRLVGQSDMLEGLTEEDYFYFVHSFVAVPDRPQCIVSETTYVDAKFCSSLQLGSLFACQFHPERSGRAGLRIYQNLAGKLATDES